MPVAGPVEAMKHAKCVVVATPLKPVAADTWSFAVEKWLRGSGPLTIHVRGLYAPGYGGVAGTFTPVPGRAVLALLRSCEGSTFSVLGPFVTPDRQWVPSGVYDHTDSLERSFSE
jgi:hypothetical protein